MARENSNEEKASSVDDNHAHLLFRSLEQYNREQKRSKRPTVVLVSLISLFLPSVGGLTVAIQLMLQPAEIRNTCIARDLVLFGASMSLLYICLHIRGARKDYRRRGPGPPQTYGQYLHASALLVSRLGIALWIAALVATAVMIARAVPMEGIAGIAPYLNLVTCIGAIPPFIIISATIERSPTPFATTGLSSSSFLTRRASECADDLTADLSVSRRASLQRKESNSASIVTLPTAEIFRYDNHRGIHRGIRTSGRNPEPIMTTPRELSNDETELMASSPIGATYTIPLGSRIMPSPPVIPPIPKIPLSLSKSPPQPVYNPGAWRNEWNSIADQVGVTRISNSAPNNSNVKRPTHSSSSYSTTSGRSSHTPIPRSASGASNGTGSEHRATPSTSIASSSQRSRLSTVRYASEPEVAVRQEIRVIRNPNYLLATRISPDKDREIVKPPKPVAVPRNTRYVSRREPPILKRKHSSNFSRPLPPSRSSETDSAVEMNLPRAYDQELARR